MTYLSWYSPFRLNLSVVKDVWSCKLGIVNHVGLFVCDETKSSRALCVWISHDHAVNNLSPLFKVTLEAFI